MTTLPIEKSSPNRVYGIKRGLLSALGILAVLAAASFFTTVVRSHGELPRGMYRFHIRNAAGRPVEGASIDVYVRNDPAQPGYFTPNDRPFSDAQGVMEFDKDAEGGPTDMMGWMLFWVFPITPPADNNVSLEINAEGYQPLRFTETDLYKFVLLNHSHAPKTKTETYNGTEVDVNLYELDFTLNEKK